MRLRTITAASVLLWSWQTIFAQQAVSWNLIQGAVVKQIAGSEGMLWALRLAPNSTGDHNLISYGGGTWPEFGQSTQHIAGNRTGSMVWMINAQGTISLYSWGSGMVHAQPGLGREITVGGDDSVWLLSQDKVAGGYAIQKYQPVLGGAGSWSPVGRGAMHIAAAKDGALWSVTETGTIERRSPSGAVETIPGTAHSIHAGLGSGSVWMVSKEAVAGGYVIYRWSPETRTWAPFGSRGGMGITESGNDAFMFDEFGNVYSTKPDTAIPITTVPGTVTFNPTPVGMPPMTTPVMRVRQTPGPGKLICSAADGGSSSYCGNTNADFVGGYKLNMSCPDGFYDPIHGGSCWKCPSNDDGRGDWIRGLGPVTDDNACWRQPKEALTKAIKVKSPAWAWECPSGSFWDGYSPDGAGGSCWKCPDTHPRRTANHISGSDACATAIDHQEKPAIFLSYNGCPRPDAETMNLAGKRTPGMPFLDIAAGWHRGQAGGGCFACPATNELGQFVIAERNGDPLYSDNNNGCRVNLKWEPPVEYIPGLSGLAGVKELIWEHQLFADDLMTVYLHSQAISRDLGTGTLAANTWVEEQWNGIATKPYSSDAFRTQIFTLLKAALAKDPASRTNGEKKLISSFAEFIREHRTYIAQQGLAMYDAWKNYHDRYEATRAKSQLETAFYYGTVPLGFNNLLHSLTGMGGFGVGAVTGPVLSYQLVWNASEKLRILALAKKGQEATRHLAKAFESAANIASKAGVVTGSSLIATAGAVLASLAIDQLVSIETARPKLESALAQAQLPVDLDAPHFKTPPGQDLLYFYWGKAMDITEIEDPQVVQLAGEARKQALANGYGMPGATTGLAVFRLTKQGSNESTIETKLPYVSWGGSKWSARIHKGVFAHTPAAGTTTHTDVIMNYVSWDGSEWTATLQPDGKTFKHTNRLTGASHPDSVLAYKAWNGENWTVKVEYASVQ